MGDMCQDFYSWDNEARYKRDLEEVERVQRMFDTLLKDVPLEQQREGVKVKIPCIDANGETKEIEFTLYKVNISGPPRRFP